MRMGPILLELQHLGNTCFILIQGYNDLSKGSIKKLTTNENNIINALLKYRVSDSTNEIVLISDSTNCFPINTTHIASNDTFPVTLIKMMTQINDKKYYIGNTLLTISNDY